ncbi:FxsA family protein [Zobellella aerophila]|uniref:FxsA family protein n=1 Tax=Zobellella aerophila TaxID=870480 RepID=A0ABP6WCB6_9GAMM
MGKVFLLFVGMTLLEIFVFIQVGSAIGAWTTIALIILTALVGINLVRHQGLKTMMDAQQKMNRGEAPAQEMLSGLMLGISGLLLLIPGFVSDLVGLALLLPPVRERLATRLMGNAQVHMRQGRTFTHAPYHYTEQGVERPGIRRHPQDEGSTFEGDYQRKDD